MRILMETDREFAGRRTTLRRVGRCVAGILLLGHAVAFSQVVCSKTVHDFGEHRSWDRRRAVFVLTNTGESTARIESVRLTCGCADLEINRDELPPGESVTIAVRLRPAALTGPYTRFIQPE